MIIRNRHWILLIPLIIVIATTVIIFSFRKNIKPFFNETAVILQIRDLVEKQDQKTIGEFYAKNAPMMWEETPQIRRGRPIQIFYYRPLEVAVGSLITLVSYVVYHHPLLPILINSFCLGLVGASLWFLSYIFLEDFFVSLAVAFFTMFSLPPLIATYQTIGIHALVCLAINIGVISYFYFTKTQNPLWMVPIFLFGCLGPLYKEYIVVMIIMVLVCEVFSSKRNWQLSIPLLVLFGYALSPAFWINLIFYHRIATTSTYSSLHIWEKIFSMDFHFEFLKYYLFAFPPTVVFLGLLSIFVNVFNLFQKSILWRVVGGVTAVGFFIFLLTKDEFLGRWGTAFFSSALILVISFSAFKIHRMFPAIFIISWLPCLIVFPNEIYLMYSLGFLAIILFFNIKVFLIKLLSISRCGIFRVVSTVIVVSLVMSFLDQTLNLLAITRTAKSMNRLVENLGQSLAKDIHASDPDTPMYFFSNNRFAKDIQFYLDKQEHIDLPVNNTLSFDLDPYYVRLDQLFPLLKNAPLKTKTYHLLNESAVNRPSPMIKVKANGDYIFELVATEVLDIKYPYFDILKYLFPEKLISFPGNPDLEIYFQKRQGLFWREVTGRFNIYQAVMKIKDEKRKWGGIS